MVLASAASESCLIWYVLKEDAQIRLFLRVSAIARFQMKPVMAFFICGNTLLFFFLVF